MYCHFDEGSNLRWGTKIRGKKEKKEERERGRMCGNVRKLSESGRVGSRARDRNGKEPCFCLKLRIQQEEVIWLIYAIPTGLAIVYLNKGNVWIINKYACIIKYAPVRKFFPDLDCIPKCESSWRKVMLRTLAQKSQCPRKRNQGNGQGWIW